MLIVIMWSSNKQGVSNKRVRLTPVTPLLNHSFLIPLLLHFLDDEDVLTGLLVTGTIMKPCLTDYLIKSSITPQIAQDITNWTRYLPVRIISIHDHEGQDLRFYSGLRSLTTHEDFDDPIPIGVLPLSLKSLELGMEFSQPIPVGVLPLGLEEVTFGFHFNQPLVAGALPQSLTSVLLSCYFNQQILPGQIPDSVKTLRLGESFSDPESEEDSEFNQPLPPGAIPNSVTNLMLSQYFTQVLQPGSLPSSLRILSIGSDFNQPFTADVVPQGLTSLSLGEKFANMLCLPPSLKFLKLKSPISNVQLLGGFPSSLVAIDLGTDTNVLPVGLLPNSLRKAVVRQSIVVGSLPSNLAVLDYHTDTLIPAGAIPETVKV